jgi:hypothetical protein
MAAEALAQFMSAYTLKGQHVPDRAMTRYRHDIGKMTENNEISTGPGRYMLGVPNRYGNAAFVAEPTLLNQRWGASHDMSSTKTDVESDLTNRGRPHTRAVCGQYNPGDDANTHALTAMPEVTWPRNWERLTDPASTLRGTGWNRWEWLCQNPQENTMVPFEYGVESRLAAKDGYMQRLAVGTPLATTQVAQEHRFLCGELYVEPAVPVARPQGPGFGPGPGFQTITFTDAYPGASQHPSAMGGATLVRDTPRGLVAPQSAMHAPGDVGAVLERIRAETGAMAPPPPFSPEPMPQRIRM